MGQGSDPIIDVRLLCVAFDPSDFCVVGCMFGFSGLDATDLLLYFNICVLLLTFLFSSFQGFRGLSW